MEPKTTASQPYERLYIDLINKERPNKQNESSIESGFCRIPLELAIEIFNFLTSEEILSFSQVNRACFLLTHNNNKNFWDKYAPGIINLNLNQDKSVMTCMINSGESEMVEVIKKIIATVQPHQSYLVECSFMSRTNGNETPKLLDPAVSIKIGKRQNAINNKKLIFRLGFLPSYSNESYPKTKEYSIDYFNPDKVQALQVIQKQDSENKYKLSVQNFIFNKFTHGNLETIKDCETHEESLQLMKDKDRALRHGTNCLIANHLNETQGFRLPLAKDSQTFASYMEAEKFPEKIEEAIKKSGLSERNIEDIVFKEFIKTLPKNEQEEFIQLSQFAKMNESAILNRRKFEAEIIKDENASGYNELEQSIVARLHTFNSLNDEIARPEIISRRTKHTEVLPVKHQERHLFKVCVLVASAACIAFLTFRS